MQSDADSVFEAAIQLSEDERFTLATRLMETVPPQQLTSSLDDPGLVEELQRRFADRDGAVSWSELSAKSPIA